jgi:adenine-specific DNA-methyltransferase
LTSGKVKAIEDGNAEIVGQNLDGSVRATYVEGQQAIPTTMWMRDSHNAQSYGTKLLSKILPGRKFPFPKSQYAVEDSLRLFVKLNHSAIVVDFFSGSGTTAHAVMRLNKQDGGRRQCISVTNNEVSADEQTGLRNKELRPGDPDWEQWGICDYITKPRIEAAITGRTPDGEPIKGDYKFTDEFPMADGFEENVEFFTMTYEAPRPVAHHKSFGAIAPLLWLKAGAQGRRIEQAAETYDIADTYAVLFDLDALDGFLSSLAEADNVHMAFIVTDDDLGFQTVCAELPPHVEAVRLYESYLTNFTINTGRG